MDVEITRVASDTLEKLKVVWDEIGSLQEARRAYVDQMAQDVLAVYESYYEKAVVYCNSLKQQVTDQMHYLHQMASELGERAPLEFTDIENLCLLAQVEQISAHIDTLEQTRAERAVHLEALVEQLRILQQELGKELAYTYQPGYQPSSLSRFPIASGFPKEDLKSDLHDGDLKCDQSLRGNYSILKGDLSFLKGDEASSTAEPGTSEPHAPSNTITSRDLNVSLDGSSNFSLQHIKDVEDCLARATDEKKAREQEVIGLESDFQELITELGCSDDVSMTYPNRLHKEAIGLLREHVQSLFQLRAKRQTQIAELAEQITVLWDKLNIGTAVREAWVLQYNGKITEGVIQSCEVELERLQQARTERVGIEIEAATSRLHVLWDELSIPQLDRTLPNLEGLLDEEKLHAIVNHKSALERHLAAIRPLIELINERESLYAEKADFEEKASNPNRLLSKKTKRDPGWLLKEEQIRKSFTTKIPKVDAALRKGLVEYQQNHHVPFLYSDRMLTQEEKEKRKKEEEKSRKDKEKAQQLEKEVLYGSAVPTPAKTPAKSKPNANTTIINTPGIHL